MRNKGFTLVELLVTITIIIVLSVTAMVSFGGSGKKTRDGRRMADLEKIRLALEVVRQIGNTYPTTAGVQTVLVPTHLQSWPSDPKSGSYNYTQVSGYSYTLDAAMEDVGSTNMSPTGSCGSGIQCNYRVTNL